MVNLSDLSSDNTNSVVNLVDNLSNVMNLFDDLSSFGNISSVNHLGDQVSNLNLQDSDSLDQFNEFSHMFNNNSLLLSDDSQINIGMKTIVVWTSELSDVSVDSDNVSLWALIIIRIFLDHSQSSSQLLNDSCVIMFTGVDWSNLSDNSKLSDNSVNSMDFSDSSLDNSSKSDNFSADDMMNFLDMMNSMDKHVWNLNMRSDVMDGVSNVNEFSSDFSDLFLQDNDLSSDNNSLRS